MQNLLDIWICPYCGAQNTASEDIGIEHCGHCHEETDWSEFD